MKKVILGVLALVFAIALVTGGYMLLTSRNLEKYAVEEGVSCPYSWQELRSGAYRLEIDTTAYPDCSWSVECYPKNVVAAAKEDSKSGTAVFSILPLNMGQTHVQVYCEQTEPLAVRVFELGMQIRVSESNEIAVEKTEHKDYAGVTALGEDGAHPVQWWADADGAVNLLIEGGAGSWAAVDYDAQSIAVSGPFYRQDSCGFEIQGKQEGAFPLVIYDGAAEAIRLEVAVAEDLSAAITDFAVEEYSIDRSEEHAALEAAAGRKLALPETAVVTGYFLRNNGGTVYFLLNDGEWDWQIAANGTKEKLIGDIAENASETKTASVRGKTLSAYVFKDSVAVFWKDGDCAMVLYGERGVSAADALAVAGQIVEESND